ncbi:MAG: translation initiation factor IF-2 [Clostridiales bacterium]|jgi:translation initiation factor IF-2|nr:translation initiation factor IF-2 [Clostridiales bacterium]
MSTLIKYRVHEVAKDFKMNSKDIAQILTEYAATPKNHMQVLEENELDIIFEYLTQHNQVEDLAEVFSVPEPEKKQDKAEEKAPENIPAKAENRAHTAQKQENKKQEQKPSENVQRPTRTVPEKRVIDTRGATVNIEKYDERLENLVPEKAQNLPRGKEKFVNKNKNRQAQVSSAKRKQEEREKLQRLQFEIAKKAPLKVFIPDEINVGELASRMKKTGAEVVRQLIKLGTMASLSDVIDYETAALVAMEMGCKVEKEVVVTVEERLIDDREDKPEELVSRAPVVVVMGHVDHGKTSLLDRVREANVVSAEAGGITQHIGAYRIEVNGSPITFLDTPGHEAFTSMRARGAMVTDIAILVVAADDGIMPQTVESINHAKAAGIPIIVAINKMDKPTANPDRIKQQLTEYELVSEEWGGDTIICPISAKTGMGIDNLLEMVVLTAEMRELKANPNRSARGTVIEARLDKGRGPIMTVLVQNGTLKQGDIIIAGTSVGHVRLMINDKGERVTEAGPSVPVEIAGMSEVPGAGDIFNAVDDERMARELVAQRKQQNKDALIGAPKKVSLEDLFAQIQQGEIKDFNIIVKADVQGSAEAVKTSLEKLTNEEVRVRVIHSAVGAISESDVMLAATSGALIVGFNVRPDNSARDYAIRANVDMRMYRVIYDCINEIESAMKGMLAPKYKEVIVGHAEVRQVIKISRIGTVCGSYVTDGKIVRNSNVRVIRDGIVVYEGSLSSLRRFKDDVKEVATNYECGISIEKFNDVKEGDIIESFIMERINV